MNNTAVTPKKSLFPGFRPTPRLVRGVDLAGQWAAPIMIVIVMIAAAIYAPAFFNPTNLKTVAIQVAVLGVVAVGQTLVLLNRSIDMSVSAVLALGAVIVVQTEAGNSIVVSLLQAIGIAALIGLANGFLVAKRHVPPFVATFGMLVFVGGARLAYTKGQASGTVPGLLRSISIEQVGPIPAALLVWLIVNLLVIFILRYTRLGRWIYAVGGNPGAARYAGINVDWVLIAAHVACSVLAILGGLLLSGYIGYVDLRLGADYNMNSIAAAIVGGTTFTGGRGNMFGTAAGVTLLIMLLNLVVVLGLSIHWQYAMQGVVLVLATALQGFRQFLLTR
ncbi:MAG: ABC transporter permease [Ardenticatenaceae bacterium]|nr:ABC transporter permease [Ardenticatenaceae bacterium]MCB9443485.1 ABC transporter permease [Ardenticatenaceae bacterium]